MGLASLVRSAPHATEAPLSAPAAHDRPVADVGGLRRIHLGMIDAVLAGEGVARVAALAAAALGGTVAIVPPALDIAVAEPQLPAGRLAAAERYVGERLQRRPVTVPAGLVAEVAVRSGDERLGAVALLGGAQRAGAREVLELAALAALTAVTLRDASVTQRRATAALLDDLRSGRAAGEIVARARRLGADLGAGASALCVRPAAGQAERVLATIAQEVPGALAAPRADRVGALLPAAPGGGDAAARRLALRLGRSGPVGLSPLEPDAAGLRRALRIAELALALGEPDPLELLSGSLRLLLGVATGDPPALSALIDATIGPLIARAELLPTLRSAAARCRAPAASHRRAGRWPGRRSSCSARGRGGGRRCGAARRRRCSLRTGSRASTRDAGCRRSASPRGSRAAPDAGRGAAGRRCRRGWRGRVRRTRSARRP